MVIFEVRVVFFMLFKRFLGCGDISGSNGTIFVKIGFELCRAKFLTVGMIGFKREDRERKRERERERYI